MPHDDDGGLFGSLALALVLLKKEEERGGRRRAAARSASKEEGVGWVEVRRGASERETEGRKEPSNERGGRCVGRETSRELANTERHRLPLRGREIDGPRSLSGAWTQSRPRPHQALDIYFVAWLKRVSEHEMTENSRTPSDCDNHCEGER